MLRVVLQGVFLWKADFMLSSPVFENLVAANASYHRPQLVADAEQLMQLPVIYLNSNFPTSQSNIQTVVGNLQKQRAASLAVSERRVREEAEKIVMDYSALALMHAEDVEDLSQFSPESREAGREEALRAYLTKHNDTPGPVFSALYTRPHQLMQRYEEAIGHANLEGNPLTDTVVVDDMYVVDIVWPATVTDPAVKAALREQIIQNYVVSRDSDKGTLEEAKAAVTISIDSIVNHQSTRIGLGKFKATDSEPAQQVAYIRRRTKFDDEHTSPLTDFDISGFETSDDLPDLAETIKQIGQYTKRYVPRRGIDIAITDQAIQKSGLSELRLRSLGPSRIAVEATIHGKQRIFQIKNYTFFDKHGKPLQPEVTDNSSKFSAFCMRALATWMCRPSVETSEGTVEEGKEGPIKGGYYAYLPVRESDGYKFRRQDEQWYYCAEEKGADLDEESERLKPLDKTGKMRNSTYYKEHADDGPHLPPLKVYL